MPAYRVQTEWTGTTGSPLLSTHYFDTAGFTDVQGAVDTVELFWNTIAALIANQVSWSTNPEVVEYTTPTLIAAFHPTISRSGAGSQSSIMLSKATQGLIRWRTGTIVNNHRVLGKTFVPSPSVIHEDDDGTPTSGYINALTAAATTLADSNLVVASRAGNVFADVVSADVWLQWAVLRGRRD